MVVFNQRKADVVVEPAKSVSLALFAIVFTREGSDCHSVALGADQIDLRPGDIDFESGRFVPDGEFDTCGSAVSTGVQRNAGEGEQAGQEHKAEQGGVKSFFM